MYKDLTGGVEKVEPGSSRWRPVTGQEPMGTNWRQEIPPEHKKTIFFFLP